MLCQGRYVERAGRTLGWSGYVKEKRRLAGIMLSESGYVNKEGLGGSVARYYVT